MFRARWAGLTLVEVLVVVAVAGLIASIAIPIVLRSRGSASTAPLGPVRAVLSAQQDYGPDGARRTE